MRQLSTMQRVRHLAVLAVLTLVGGLALAGCRSEPGVAAYVGTEKITVDRVDSVIAAVDKVNAQRTAETQPGPIPISRQLVLGLIVYGELEQQLITEKGLNADSGNIDAVAQTYGIPVDHPYAQLLGAYFDRFSVLRKNAGSATPSKEQILRYYHAGVAAQVFPAGASDDVVLANLNGAGVTADLNVQAMIDELAKKQDVTVNPMYAELPMPVLIATQQGNVIAGLQFRRAGEPFVTDASGDSG
jgi:hypothetical protein